MIFLTRDWYAVRRGQNSQHKSDDDSLGVGNAKPGPGAIKILSNGDLVADAGAGFSETLQWTAGNYAHFQTVARHVNAYCRNGQKELMNRAFDALHR